MIPVLYESTETAFAMNGICRLPDCLTCTVTEERNGLFECDFTYPVTGRNFEKITPGRIIFCWHDDTEEGQPFDIVSYTKPINGVVAFHAVHVSYRQSYLTVSGTGINSLADAFAMMKRDATPANPFTYITDKTSTGYLAAADGTPRSVRQMLGGVDGSILDAYGGEYKWDYFTVSLLAQRGQFRDSVIRYGVNLTDYVDDTNYQGTYSSCVAFWKGTSPDDGLETVVKTGRLLSGSETYTKRGECIPLDLTDKFETRPTVAQLTSAAQAHMRQEQTIIPVQSITVDFLHLSEVSELSDFEQLLKFQLCDTVWVVFPGYNVDANFKIVRTVYDVLGERYEQLELGKLSTTLSEALGISPGGDKRGFDGGNLAVDNLFARGNLNVSGDAYFDNGHGVWLTDRTGFRYPGVIDNGQNLWIGAFQRAGKHHTGYTFISSGYNAAAGDGWPSIKVVVPNAANEGGNEYFVYHEGYLPVAVVAKTFNSVAITTRSGGGAYYSGTLTLPAEVSNPSRILSVTVSDFSGAAASFEPLFNGSRLLLMSDISQTVSAVSLRFAYIK